LSTDVVVIVKGGIFYRTTVDALRQGLATATASSKGLLSASDKLALDTAVSQVASILTPPSTPIASAATIAIPAGRYDITLSGTTEVTAVTGMVPRVLYKMYYPTGAGLTFLGNDVRAGDAPLLFADV
jgi:hypothetical protein